MEIVCESLPCPCAAPGDGGGAGGGSGGRTEERKASCARPRGVQRILFSRRKYPNIQRHHQQAIRLGWPRTLVVNRKGADRRRDKLMSNTTVIVRGGRDRDEYPPAVGRGRGTNVLMRGSSPTGWRAHVRSVPTSENRSHGATLGNRLRRFCDGVKFRYAFD